MSGMQASAPGAVRISPPLGAARAAERIRGFTLIEVAIVVAIVGVLLGAMLAPLSARYELVRLRQARGALAQAEEALYGFALTHGRLPCPDRNGDGR